MILFSIQLSSFVLWNKIEKIQLGMPANEITKVGYLLVSDIIFSSILVGTFIWGSILAWHVIIHHASTKLLCIFWFMAAVAMLLVIIHIQNDLYC